MFIILVTLTLLSLASCSTGSDVGMELIGPVWIVTKLNGQEPLPDTTISAEFTEEGTVNGLASCNNYNTSYTVDGHKISFNEPIAATQKLCAEPENLQEQAYFQALSDTTTFSIEGKQFILHDADDNDVVVYSAQSQQLKGSSWQVISYNNGRGGVVSVIIGTEITANFGEDGQLNGNAGCNGYNAAYQVDGDKITIGPAATTRKACTEPEGVMEQEAAYLADLQTAATYRVEENSMQMRSPENTTVANFSRVP